MPKETYKEGMTKKDIYKKIDKLKTNNSKIDYLNSFEPKVGLMKKETIGAFYEVFGDVCASGSKYSIAARYYEKAGLGKEGLIKVGDEAFKKKSFDVAAEYYEKAGEKEKAKKAWIKAADKQLLEGIWGGYHKAADYYKNAGLIDKAKKCWIKAGDRLRSRQKYHPANWWDEAEEYYEKADYKKGFIKLGKDALAYGRFNLTVYYYEKAGYEKGLIKLAKIAIRDNSFKDAKILYEKVGFDKSNNIKELKTMAKVYDKAGEGVKSIEIQRKIEKLQSKK